MMRPEDFLEEPEVEEPIAWTRYDIRTQGEELVVVHFSTNDDGDTGWPGVFAEEDYRFKGVDALDKAKKFTGTSRQGVGHKVSVTLDGEEV